MINFAQLRERRQLVEAAMQGRAGQLRKGKVADDFDAFMHDNSGETRGWDSAMDEDVLDWFCFFDSQGGGTK